VSIAKSKSKQDAAKRGAAKRGAERCSESAAFKLRSTPDCNQHQLGSIEDELSGVTRRKKLKNRRDVSQSYWAREQADISDVDFVDRVRAVKQFGNFSLAYSTAVQPTLQHFKHEDGLIAFRTRWGVDFALGDPLCRPSNLDSTLREFIADRKNPSFCQVSRTTAQSLASLGYVINEMGVDTEIALADYSFSGKSKEWLRYAANWTTRRGYQVLEATFDAVGVDEVESVSEAWRKTRTVKQKEVRFLNRPIVLEDEPDVRKFFLLDKDEKVVAFVFLDPLYESGRVIGFVTSIKRRLPDAPVYAEQAIMKAIIEKLQSENVTKLKLGLSPCAWIEPSKFRESQLRRWVFKRAYASRLINRHAYNLVGHANYKRRFRGKEEKVYLATPPKFHPLRMAALIALCGIA
jgi:phosphatidylglycerol lysyltransferase